MCLAVHIIQTWCTSMAMNLHAGPPKLRTVGLRHRPLASTATATSDSVLDAEKRSEYVGPILLIVDHPIMNTLPINDIQYVPLFT